MSVATIQPWVTGMERYGLLSGHRREEGVTADTDRRAQVLQANGMNDRNPPACNVTTEKRRYGVIAHSAAARLIVSQMHHNVSL